MEFLYHHLHYLVWEVILIFYFYFCYFSFAILFKIKYINSSLFWNAVGLRENELHLPALGIEPDRVILRVNIISAMFGSVSGVLIEYLTVNSRSHFLVLFFVTCNRWGNRILLFINLWVHTRCNSFTIN